MSRPKGFTISEEHKARIGAKNKIALKERWKDPEYRERMRKSHLGNTSRRGKKASEETRRKISEAGKGRKCTRKGVPLPERTKKLISEALKGKNEGELNWIWKGDDVGYRTLHRWVERHLGFHPSNCSVCGTSGKLTGKVQLHWNIQWANLSRKYLRNLTDWAPMCTKCHGKYDAGMRRKANQ